MSRALGVGTTVAVLLLAAGCSDDPRAGINVDRQRPGARTDAGGGGGGGGDDGCTTDSDCPFGQSCRNGICEGGPGAGPQDQGCRSDDDCPQGYLCAHSTGACVPEAGGPGNPVPADPPCTDGDTRRCGIKVGACDYGSELCVNRRWSGVCEGGIGPSAELCNATDDDCNGLTDESYGLGVVCHRGVGACGQFGQIVCSADTSTSGCSVSGLDPTGRVELCGNGIDDDCDGTTDEGFVLNDPCTVGIGGCSRDGVTVCTADGLTTECSVIPGMPGADELCGNGVDDNCDGQTDENYVLNDPCDAGVGACNQPGVTICSPDLLSTVCSAQPLSPGPFELCGNSADDDCNGQVDEGFVLGGGCSAGQGACQRSGNIICSPDLLSTVCDAVPLNPAGRREVCNNGVDDDCNGQIDDGCNAPVAICPAPLQTRPLTPVTLMGNGSDSDGVIVSWRWDIVAPPNASASFSNQNAQNTNFTPNLVGVYTVRLTVTDDSGLTGQCTTTVTARGEGIRVEVTWNTNNSDVDTHLLRRAGGTPWFNFPDDCYYANRTPSWDAAGTADDPRLDIDDTNGFGPENINIDVPVTSASYRVGIHFYSDHGAGPTSVTVRIFCGDIAVTPVTTQTRIMTGAGASDSNQFWRVADVQWLGNDMCNATVLSLPIITGAVARTTP